MFYVGGPSHGQRVRSQACGPEIEKIFVLNRDCTESTYEARLHKEPDGFETRFFYLVGLSAEDAVKMATPLITEARIYQERKAAGLEVFEHPEDQDWKANLQDLFKRRENAS